MPDNDDSSKFYQLRYKRNGNEKIKFFYFTGTYPEAVKRSQAFCDKIGVKHVWTCPAILNFDDIESRVLEGSKVNELE